MANHDEMGNVEDAMDFCPGSLRSNSILQSSCMLDANANEEIAEANKRLRTIQAPSSHNQLEARSRVASEGSLAGELDPAAGSGMHEDVQFEAGDPYSNSEDTGDAALSSFASNSVLRGSYLLDEAINTQIAKAKQRLKMLEAKPYPVSAKAKGRLSEDCGSSWSKSLWPSSSCEEDFEPKQAPSSYNQLEVNNRVASEGSLGSGLGPAAGSGMHEDVQFEAGDPYSNSEDTGDAALSSFASNSVLRGSYLLDEAINTQIAKAKQRLKMLEDVVSTKSPRRSSEDCQGSQSKSWWKGVLGNRDSIQSSHNALKAKRQSADVGSAVRWCDSGSASNVSSTLQFVADEGKVKTHQVVQSPNSILHANRGLNASINNKTGELMKNTQNPEDKLRTKLPTRSVRFSEDCRISRPRSRWEGENLEALERSHVSSSSLQAKRQGVGQESIFSSRKSEGSWFGPEEVNTTTTKNLRFMESSSSNILRANHLLNASINEKIAELKKNMQNPEDDASTKKEKRPVRFSEDGRSSRSTMWWPMEFLGRHKSAPEPQPARLQGVSKVKGACPSSSEQTHVAEPQPGSPEDARVDGPARKNSMTSAKDIMRPAAPVNSILHASLLLDASINKQIAELKKNLQEPEVTPDHGDAVAQQSSLFHIPIRDCKKQAPEEGAIPPHAKGKTHPGVQKPPSGTTFAVAGLEAGNEAWEEDPVSPATITLMQAVRVSFTWLPGYELVRGVLGAANCSVFGKPAAMKAPNMKRTSALLPEPEQMKNCSHAPEDVLMELFEATGKQFAVPLTPAKCLDSAAQHSGPQWSMESAAEMHAEALKLGSFIPPRVVELRSGVSHKPFPKARTVPRSRSASMDEPRRTKSRFSMEVNRFTSLPENIAVSPQMIQ